MKKTTIVYGLISGAVVSAFMATTMLTTMKNGGGDHGWMAMLIGYLGMLIAFSFIFVGVKQYRDKHNQGAISFGKAFGMGALISLIASTMYVLTWAVVYHQFMPNFMENYSAAMIREAEASLSGARLQAKIAEINKGKELYATPLGFALFTYVEILPVGILVSLIVAGILRRKKKTEAVEFSVS